MIFATDLDNSLFNLDLDIASMGGNGVWREHYYYQKCGRFCDSFKLMLPKFFNKFIKSAGLSCSKNINKKGNYTLNHVDLLLDFHLPFIPYNHYKVDVVFLKKAKRIGCLQFFCDVVPKRNS
nr:uncharacterized protein LOC106678443 [Halyomorpha halys]